MTSRTMYSAYTETVDIFRGFFHPHAYHVAERRAVDMSGAARIGHWVINKYRLQAADAGVAYTAHQLRKRGVPLWAAMFILTGKTIKE